MLGPMRRCDCVRAPDDMLIAQREKKIPLLSISVICSDFRTLPTSTVLARKMTSLMLIYFSLPSETLQSELISSLCRLPFFGLGGDDPPLRSDSSFVAFPEVEFLDLERFSASEVCQVMAQYYCTCSSDCPIGDTVIKCFATENARSCVESALIGAPLEEATAQRIVSKAWLRSVVVRSYIKSYLRVLERRFARDPAGCLQKLSAGGTDYTALLSLLLLPGRIAEQISPSLQLLEPVLTSCVSILRMVFSDAHCAAVLQGLTPSPMAVWLENFNLFPAQRHDVRLRLVQGTAETLCDASRCGKAWLEHFTLSRGPQTVVSALVAWCTNAGETNHVDDHESACVFDTIARFVSLQDSGAAFSKDLYSTLACWRWGRIPTLRDDWPVKQQCTSIGLFGYKLLTRCCMAAQSARPLLAYFLSRLLLVITQLGSDMLILHGQVTCDVVNVFERYIRSRCNEDERDEQFVEFVWHVGFLCGQACRTIDSVNRQKGGLACLCRLVTALAAHPSSVISAATVKAIRAATTVAHRTIFFDMLGEADLIEALCAELIMPNTSNLRKMHMLRLLHELVSSHATLQGRVANLAGNVAQLLRLAAKDFHESLPLISRLLSSIKIVVYDPQMLVCTSLVGLLLDLNVTSVASVVSCCWALQSSVQLVAQETCVKTYFRDHRADVISVLGKLCPFMRDLHQRTDPADASNFCEQYDEVGAVYRQHGTVSGGAVGTLHYLAACDCLVLTSHLLNLVQCCLPGEFAMSLCDDVSRCFAAGPFLTCRLYTTIVVRTLAGMACWTGERILSSCITVGSWDSCIERSSQISLQDLTNGLEVRSSVGDYLFAVDEQRVVRPCYISCLVTLLRSSTAALDLPDLSNLLMVISSIDFLFRLFQPKFENLFSLTSLGLIDVAAEHLLRGADMFSEFRERASSMLSSLVEQFWAFGVSTRTIQAHLMLCVASVSESQRVFQDRDTKRTLTLWNQLLQLSLPCTNVCNMLAIGAGCEAVVRSRLLQSIAIGLNKREINTHGGIDICTNYEVWRTISDTAVSCVLWIMLDRPSSAKEHTVLLSLHFDKSRVCVELCVDEQMQLVAVAYVRSANEIKTKSVVLSDIPQLPLKQWCMITFSVSNFCNKPQALRTKFTTTLSAGIFSLSPANNTLLRATTVKEIEVPQSIREKSFATSNFINMFCIAAAKPSSGEEHDLRVAQQVFFGSFAMFMTELSALDELVFFTLGSDALLQMDFLDRTNVLRHYPIVAHFAGMVEMEKTLMRDLTQLSTLWTKFTESAEGSVYFSGSVFPFTKSSRDKLVCVLGVTDSDVGIATRVEGNGPASTSSDPISASSPSALTEGSRSDKTPYNNSSIAPAVSAPFLAANAGASDFVFNRARPLTILSLQLFMDDVADDKPVLECVVEKPRVFQLTPFYSVVESLGGVHQMLWIASLLEENSATQVEAMRCVSTMLALHMTEPIPDQIHGAGSKRQTLPMLTSLLHTRIGVNPETALALCLCCGSSIVAREDLLPLLLDFSLWSRSDSALRAVTGHLAQLYCAHQSILQQFNARFLERHLVLDSVLLHLHMHFGGNTNTTWTKSMIPSIQSLAGVLCSDIDAVGRVVASAVWLSMDERAEAADWTKCLLGAAIQAVEGSALRGTSFDDELCDDVVSLLKSTDNLIREKALRLIDSVPLTLPIICGIVAAYQARSLRFTDSACVSHAELHILFGKLAGDELYVTADLTLARAAWDSVEIRPATKPLLFVLIALIPSLSVSYQHTVVAFVAELFRCSSVVQQAIVGRQLGPGVELTLSQVVLFALQETFVRSDSSADFVGGSLASALVTLLTEYCCSLIHGAASSASSSASSSRFVGAISGIAFAIFNIFVVEDDVESRCSTAFRYTRHHLLQLCTACLDAFNSHIGSTASLSFMNAFFDFLDMVVNDLTVLLFFSQRSESSDDVAALADESIAYPASSAVRRAGEASGHLSLRVRKVYHALFGQDRFEQLLNKDNLDLMPIFALQTSAKLSFSLLCGKFPSIEKSATQKLISQLNQQQLRLVSYLASIRGFDLVQLLAVLHLCRIAPKSYLLELPVEKDKSAPGRAKAVKNSRFASVPHILAQPETLLMSTAATARCKDISLSLIPLAVGWISMHQQGGHSAFVGKRACLGMELCRVLLLACKDIFGRDVSDECMKRVEWLSTEFGEQLPANAVATSASALQCVPEKIFSASGLTAVQNRNESQKTYSTSRVTLKANFLSAIANLPQLDVQKTLMALERVATRLQQYQSAILLDASLYRKKVEEDGNAIIAVNASTRFAILPWWGDLAMLYTHQSVELNRWELDRFVGPEWERTRFRRFARKAKMTRSADHVGLHAAPIAAAVISPLDDVMLLNNFTVTSIPQLIGAKALRSDATSHRCLLVLPMERVPIMFYISDTTVSYVVEWQRQPSAGARSVSPLELADLPTFRIPTFAPSGRQAVKRPANFKYEHEIPSFRRVIDIKNVRAVWPRRSLLQHVAVELLLTDGETLFVAFDSEHERKSVLERLTAIAKQYLDKTLILSDANRRVWRSWWADGKISTFKYLLYLNWAAGRSYADLRQYPVFPHIVADYGSDRLDLMSTSSFRLLDRPMGAQTPEREEKVRSIYEELASCADENDATNYDMAPRHYGTHYSPPGAVLHFAVRVQPFTDYFLDMNSHLDDPDRVFDSMVSAYSISSTGKDVKEMIPEFYCLPQMFLNVDHIPFGTRQDGVIVHDVQLPRWASSSRAFVMFLREALESRFVSENIHKWIDLIFGSKQRGKEAVAAFNVFHALTYEGAVDLSKIDDLVQRRSNESQIDNYGQVPMQLFTAAQKPRVKPGSDFSANPCPTIRFDASLSRTSILLNADRIFPSTSFHVESTTSIAFCRPQISNASWGADEASADLFLFSASSKLPIGLPPNCVPFFVQGDQPRDYISLRPHSVALIDANPPMKDVCCMVLPRLTITCCDVDVPFVYVGSSTGVIAVLEVSFDEWSTEVDDVDSPGRINRTKSTSMSLLDTFVGHTASVRTIKAAPSWGLIVSVGADRVVAVWDKHKRVLIRTIPSPAADRLFPRSLLQQTIIRDLQFVCVTVAVNPKRGDIVVAGYNASLLPGEVDSPQVRLFTLNGELVTTSDRGHSVNAALAFEPYVFLAEGKSVFVLNASNLTPVEELTHNGVDDVIVSLALNPYGTLLAACDAVGNVVTWKVQ